MQTRTNGVSDDVLFSFAITLAGLPDSCQARITSSTEDGKFGQYAYSFKNGITYEVQSSPPETGAVTLSASHGFPDATVAFRELKKSTEKVGLHIDWASHPELRKSGETETQTFWSSDSGANARGFLSYRDGHLVAIGYGTAL